MYFMCSGSVSIYEVKKQFKQEIFKFVKKLIFIGYFFKG